MSYPHHLEVRAIAMRGAQASAGGAYVSLETGRFYRVPLAGGGGVGRADEVVLRLSNDPQAPLEGLLDLAERLGVVLRKCV